MLASLAFVGPIVVLLGLWVRAVQVRRQGRQSSPRAVIAASVCPPILVCLVLLTAHGRFGDLRVALEGFRFEIDQLAEAGGLRIGGSPASDHLVVKGLPAGMLSFSPASEGQVDVKLRSAATSGSGGGPVFSALRVNHQRPFHNAVEIGEEGLTVAIGASEELPFSLAGPGFDGAGYPVLPSRHTEILGLSLPIGRQLPPEQAIYPLRYYAAPAIGRNSGEQQKQLRDGQGHPLGSFLCRGTGAADGLFGRLFRLRRSLFLVPVDNELRFARSMEPAHRLNPLVTTIEDGTSVHLALFRIDYHDPRATEVRRASRTQELRSFSARSTAGVLELVLDTPGIVRLRRSELARMARLRQQMDQDGVMITLAGREFLETIASDQMALHFPFLGEPLTSELFTRITWAEQATSHFTVTTHSGTRRHRFGDAFQVGGDAAVVVRISRLGFPWATLGLVWLFAISALLAGKALRQGLPELVLLTGCELFLAVRVVIAYQAAYIDPGAASATWRALASFALVPFVLQLALALYRRQEITANLVHSAVALTGCALILLEAGVTVIWILLILIALLAMPFLLLLLMRTLDRLPLQGSISLRWPLLLAGLLLVVRLATLLGFGWKERISIGNVALAVSIYSTPWILLIFALLWGRITKSRSPRQHLKLGLLYWVGLALLFLAVPLIARDWGTALIFSIPVTVLFALPLFDRTARSEKGLLPWILALPLLVMIGAHFGSNLVPALGLSHRVASWDSDDERAAVASPAAAERLLASRTDTSHDAMRLFKRMAPEKLREVGTSDAESLLLVMENLRSYATRGIFGEGMLGVPLSAPLRSNHLDDNVSVVHILAAFGWLGGFVLLLVPAFWALLPLITASRDSGTTLLQTIDPRRAFALMTLWTFFAAAMYMFSANTELLLFTGKNVYFLAAASLSDIVEATLLVALALWALLPGPQPQSESAAAGGGS